MGKEPEKRPYNLEERTFRFTKELISFVAHLPHTIPNKEIIRQVVRSAGSVGANYIEANESLSKKDFMMRLKICRKEARETEYWLKLLDCQQESETDQQMLMSESKELIRIFSAIINKTSIV